MRVSGISQRLHVGGSDLGIERPRPRTPLSERMVDDGVGGRRQHALRKRLGLRQQRPGPEAQREPRIGPLPYGLRRHDVENGEPLDAFWMVERQTIRNPTAAVVSGDREPRESEPLHHAHHVLRHGTLRVWRVVRRGRRTTAAPITAKIRADDREVTREQRRDAAPHQVRLRKAVQQENRRPAASRADEDRCVARVDLGRGEVVHHRYTDK